MLSPVLAPQSFLLIDTVVPCGDFPLPRGMQGAEVMLKGGRVTGGAHVLCKSLWRSKTQRGPRPKHQGTELKSVGSYRKGARGQGTGVNWWISFSLSPLVLRIGMCLARMVARACNTSPWEAESRGSPRVQGQPGLQEPCRAQNLVKHWAHESLRTWRWDTV